MINLHPTQSLVYKETFVDNKVRFPVTVCSRGWGKSHLLGTAAVTSCFELMELAASVPNKNVCILAPTFDQVRDIYTPLFANQFGLSNIVLDEKVGLGRYYWHNNVELHLLSYEAVERMRGKEIKQKKKKRVTVPPSPPTTRASREGGNIIAYSLSI